MTIENSKRRELLKKMLIAGVSIPIIMKLLPDLMADPKVASDEWDLDSVKLYLDKTNLANSYLWEDGTDPILQFDTGDQLLYDISENKFLFQIGGVTELSLSATELKLDGVDLNVNNRNLDDVASIDGGGNPIVIHDDINVGVDGTEAHVLRVFGTDAGEYAYLNRTALTFAGATTIGRVQSAGSISLKTLNAASSLVSRLDVQGNADTVDIDILNANLDLNNNLLYNQVFERVAVSANHTTGGEMIVGCDTSGGAFTVTLATADCIAGRIIIMKDESGNAATNVVTIATEGAETIDGNATVSLMYNYGAYKFYSDGSNWHIY